MAVVPSDVEDQITALVTLIRTNVNPRKACEHALRAVINSSSHENAPSGPAAPQQEPEGPNLIAYAAYPKLCHLLGLLARHPVLAKKNTVTILHEYATRTSLVVRCARPQRFKSSSRVICSRYSTWTVPIQELVLNISAYICLYSSKRPSTDITRI